MSARLTAEQRRLRNITERDWQATVIAIARALGWRHYAPPKAKDVKPGWPASPRYAVNPRDPESELTR